MKDIVLSTGNATKDTVLQTLVGLYVIVIGVNIVFAFLFLIYLSKLITSESRTKNAWKDLFSSLNHRFALFSDLLATFERYVTEHDEKFYQETKRIHNLMVEFKSTPLSYLDRGKFARLVAAQIQYAALIKSMLEMTATYPTFIKQPHYLMLHDSLENTETKIDSSIRAYQQSADTYNKLLITFPITLVANLMRFSSKPVLKQTLCRPKTPSL